MIVYDVSDIFSFLIMTTCVIILIPIGIFVLIATITTKISNKRKHKYLTSKGYKRISTLNGLSFEYRNDTTNDPIDESDFEKTFKSLKEYIESK